VSFINPDRKWDKHRYTEQKDTDGTPYDDNGGIIYDKVVIDHKRPHWRITRYPRDKDALETYKYLPTERYIVNVISKEKCIDCKKHEAEREIDNTVKLNPAAFMVERQQ
jgi:hypothetical protein